MIKKMSTSAFFLFSILSFSQTQIKVLDSENQKPIPYAKIILKDKDYYKNTEENGETNLEKNEEISEIQSFGYENLIVKNTQTSYFLQPKFINIQEVEIFKPKNTISITESKIKKEFPSHFFRTGISNWTILNFFEYKSNYPQKTFINKIKIHTAVKKNKKPAKINLVIYDNDNGKPSSEILQKYIIECMPGNKITELNLQKSPILFPKEGIFIGFEAILNEENSYYEDVVYIDKDGKKETKKMKVINPDVYSEKTDINTIWISTNGKWFPYSGLHLSQSQNRRLSIQLELTD